MASAASSKLALNPYQSLNLEMLQMEREREAREAARKHLQEISPEEGFTSALEESGIKWKQERNFERLTLNLQHLPDDYEVPEVDGRTLSFGDYLLGGLIHMAALTDLMVQDKIKVTRHDDARLGRWSIAPCQIENFHLGALSMRLPRLTTLSLHNCGRLTLPGLGHLSKFPSLTDLTLTGCTLNPQMLGDPQGNFRKARVTDVGDWLNRCQKLKRLTLEVHHPDHAPSKEGYMDGNLRLNPAELLSLLNLKGRLESMTLEYNTVAAPGLAPARQFLLDHPHVTKFTYGHAELEKLQKKFAPHEFAIVRADARALFEAMSGIDTVCKLMEQQAVEIYPKPSKVLHLQSLHDAMTLGRYDADLTERTKVLKQQHLNAVRSKLAALPACFQEHIYAQTARYADTRLSIVKVKLGGERLFYTPNELGVSTKITEILRPFARELEAMLPRDPSGPALQPPVDRSDRKDQKKV